MTKVIMLPSAPPPRQRPSAAVYLTATPDPSKSAVTEVPLLTGAELAAQRQAAMDRYEERNPDRRRRVRWWRRFLGWFARVVLRRKR